MCWMGIILAIGAMDIGASFDVVSSESAPPASRALDPRFEPPPIPHRIGPKLVIAAGLLALSAGVIGMAWAEDCRSRDAQSRCTDPYGGSTVFPSLAVVGLATTITGSYWHRRGQRTYGDLEE